ncbi:plasmid pRiA4b ORF-3 family protein [Microbacterium aerolatum]|uniref:plasmid pRiA4b ORF-3 family protein n=1 Tax=Microbacterium aerolatum TaxID=153731 RepID=UPI0020018CC3|nr:plasmid pRiA4b ORF-3 family protein [Microbacterium aerolatum]MCK3771105.1 plasmid pRiA4b ORF-3 family protein [Microbacterium aerolatum]
MTRYRLRATLAESDPEIWRVFDVSGDLRLRMLHLALQTIMGWRESHLHAFTDTDPYTPGARGRRWESPDFEPADDSLSEEEYTVDDVLGGVTALWYEYDFGDGWVHRLDVIERAADDPHLAPVVLLDGANRGPFEDSGGPHGYAEKLAIATDPQHPDHGFITDWIRTTVGPWTPREPGNFDVVGIQTELNLLFNPHGSGMSPYDMSGLVKSEEHRRPGDVDDASPIAAFASELPPPIRSELRQHLHYTGVLEPTGIDDETAARLIRPFSWLMDAVGVDGLALSTAGWMPPATVLAGMTELEWLDDWVGKGNREDLTPPIASLREAAQRMGLVRVQKGRLVLSAAAKKALGDPRLQLRLVASGLYRKLGDAETDAATLLLLATADGTPPAERWKTVAFGLEMCGWQSATRMAFTASDIAHATFHTRQVLDLIGGASRFGRLREEDPGVRLFAAEALR